MGAQLLVMVECGAKGRYKKGGFKTHPYMGFVRHKAASLRYFTHS